MPHDSPSWDRSSPMTMAGTIFRYGLPIVATALVVAARTLLAPALGHQAPLLAFTLAVMISAHAGGTGPGLLATLLGGVAGAFFFMEPEHGLHPIAVTDQVHLVFFAVIGVSISLLSHAMRQARDRAAAGAAASAAGENRLRALVAELARSNAELDQFAAVVSHDLRSPLQTISAYVHLLRAEDNEHVSSELRETLAGIRDGIGQMDRLINTLLAGSRVGRAGLNAAPCDARTIIDRVLAGLAGQLKDAGARVSCRSLPVVRADDVLLTQVMQNLIENAIKYRGEAPPEIHVSARQQGDEWLFSVRDNGIGVAPEHHQRVFQMFQRLHSDKSSYGGCGIGLATCKKIIERHGGRIWLESQIGQGSTLCFSLPA